MTADERDLIDLVVVGEESDPTDAHSRSDTVYSSETILMGRPASASVNDGPNVDERELMKILRLAQARSANLYHRLRLRSLTAPRVKRSE